MTSDNGVTIIGAGIFGLSAAWDIINRGIPVRVIDAKAVGAGASGGHVGALAPHVPEDWKTKKQVQLESLLMAADFWAKVGLVSDLDPGYARLGRVQPVPDLEFADRMSVRIKAAEFQWPAGIGMRLTDTPPGDLIPMSPTGLYLVDDLAARINPRAALGALALAIEKRGGRIEIGQPAPDDLDGQVIWANGAAGLYKLSDELGHLVGNGVKGQSALMTNPFGDGPQVFADGLHIVPHGDGTIGVGSTSERYFDHLDPDDQLDDLIARAVIVCPRLQKAQVIDRWAGLRPRAKSRAPVLGPWPNRPGHFVMNGGFKIGFGMAPILARMIADLVVDDVDQVPQEFRF